MRLKLIATFTIKRVIPLICNVAEIKQNPMTGSKLKLKHT